MTQIATLIYALGICGLFWLDRDPKARTSPALWIPVVWMWIASSRAVSLWWQAGPTLDSPDQYLEGSPVDRAVLSALLGLGLIVLIRRSRKVQTLLRANAPIVLFFVYCGISVLWSDFADVAFKRWIRSLGDIVMVLVVLTDPERSTAVKRFLSRTAFILIPLSVLFVKYYPNLGRAYNRWTWTPYYSGVTTNKNSLGMICLLFGLASMWRFLAAYRRGGKHRTRHLIAHGALLGMVFWLFWIADSVTSLSCFILASGVLVATHLRIFSRKPVLVHILVAAIVAISAAVLFGGAGSGLVQNTTGRDTTTLTGRTQIWTLALSMAGNPIIGTGYESFWLGKRLAKMWEIDRNITQAHNGYLEMYLNLGWIGVALLAAILVTGYRHIFAVYRADAESGQIGLAYFAVAVVYNLTEATFQMGAPIWILLLLSVTAVPRRSTPSIRTAVGEFPPSQSSHELVPVGSPLFKEYV